MRNYEILKVIISVYIDGFRVQVIEATHGTPKSSPGDVARPKFVSKKMKKIVPKVKEKANLSWFDTDNVFGFEG